MLKAVVFAVGALALAPHASAQPAASGGEAWGPAPPGLPAGSQVAVMSGDPTKAGPFVLRVKMPAGYTIPPHWHPSDENLTLISGDFSLGMGETLDPAKAQSLGVGKSATAAANMRHFAMSKDGAVLQVASQGPFQITYVNPADDPRRK